MGGSSLRMRERGRRREMSWVANMNRILVHIFLGRKLPGREDR